MNLQSKIFTLLICFSTISAAAEKTSKEIIEGCWAEGAHPAMAACVERYAKAANLSLGEVERTARNIIVAKATTYVDAAKARKKLESSIASFHAYRHTECNFREIISKVGNSSDSIKQACEAELDDKRASELRRDIEWFE